jgi:hypothetical protein
VLLPTVVPPQSCDADGAVGDVQAARAATVTEVTITRKTSVRDMKTPGQRGQSGSDQDFVVEIFRTCPQRLVTCAMQTILRIRKAMR